MIGLVCIYVDDWKLSKVSEFWTMTRDDSDLLTEIEAYMQIDRSSLLL